MKLDSAHFALFEQEVEAELRGVEFGGTTAGKVVHLLSRNRQVICVQEYRGHESMSDLLSRGSMTATLIAENPKARAYVRDSMPDQWEEGRAAIENLRPKDPALIFAFAVLMPPGRQPEQPEKLAARLPLFDKIDYYLRKSEMERLGYKVEITSVPVGQ